MFYNTTELTGEELKAARASAETQEDVVIEIFKTIGRPLSPSQVLEIVQAAGSRWPITSVRRAMTNLTKEHQLEKLKETRIGAYGARECLWKLPERVKDEMSKL